jgi:UDPglucose 6-dehydrogenase
MKVCVIGTGYVGLVTAACLASLGNDVICHDKIIQKMEMLRKGDIFLYEPVLKKIIDENIQLGRMHFSEDIKYTINNSFYIFITVPTPNAGDGSTDLTEVYNVVNIIGEQITDEKIVIIKSTVPLGTAETAKNIIVQKLKERGVQVKVEIVSNPEFLREGSAVHDFMNPDRIILGLENQNAAQKMRMLYEKFIVANIPVMVMDLRSAELAKYASNSMLATKISFINEIARLCDVTGADIKKVTKSVGSDHRIGYHFLDAGLGYGGSCFPKDIQSIIRSFEELGLKNSLLKAVDSINREQRDYFMNKIKVYFHHDLNGKKLAIWGLAFKPKTNDMREAPSLTIIQEIIGNGGKVSVFDPEAMNDAKNEMIHWENVEFCNEPYEALLNADGLVLITEWDCFANPDFYKMGSLLKNKIIFDGRNLYQPEEVRKYGFQYYGIGR